MKKLRIWLSHPWLPAIVALLAVGLTLPSLWNGLNLDDNFHRLILLGDRHTSVHSSSPLNLFCFMDGDIEENRRLKNIGSLPWWSTEKFKVCFFRPLSALTHWLDYLLWPDTPALMHVQSLVWFGILVALVALLYRRIMGATWVAGLAGLFFAIDDARGPLAGWLANRNALISGVFGVLCLMAHDRWRGDGWRSAVFLGPVCFALALLSAEAGIATGAYLLAYALFLERGSLRDRIAGLIPYGVVLFLWGLVYVMLDYGAQGMPFYTDPLKEPLLYLKALFFRAPIYLLGQWALPPVFCYLFWPSFMHKAGLIFAVFLALILTPLVRRDRIARFWTVGMLLSLLPICATMPNDRNLLFVGLGTMGLLAQLFSWIDQVEWSLKSRLFRIAAHILLVLFILIHVVFAPVGLFKSARIFALLDKQVERASASLPSSSEFKNRKFVLVNPPNYLFFVANLITLRAVQGQFIPVRALTSGNHSLILTRTDSRTIEIRAKKGSLTEIDNFFIKSKQFPMQPGQEVELSDMSVEVLEADDGLPSAASFQFSVPLEDESLAWFRWQNGVYIPFILPAIGETITMERTQFKLGKL